MKKSSKKYNSKGVAGEFYVAAYLASEEMLVALPQAGVPGLDMFVGAVGGGPPIRVQVKSTRAATKNDKQVGPIYLWQTKDSISEALPDESLWFAFVWLKGWPQVTNDVPEVFFVPFVDVIARMKLVRAEIEQFPGTWPYFWLGQEEAKKYMGQAGLAQLRAAMNPKPLS